MTEEKTIRADITDSGAHGRTKFGHPYQRIEPAVVGECPVMVAANLKDQEGRFLKISEVFTATGEPVTLSLSVSCEFPDNDEGLLAIGRMTRAVIRQREEYLARRKAEREAETKGKGKGK